MDTNQTTRIHQSLSVIFGDESLMNAKRILAGLEYQGLKKAFHAKIKKVHPDKAMLEGKDPQLLNDEAGRVNDAYHHLRKYLSEKASEPKLLYYQGAIPQRKLRFAEYLYYKGLMDWNTLISSLVWQSRNRPKVGEIAVDMKMLKLEDLLTILRARRFNEKFGDAAVRINKLHPAQLQTILSKQKLYFKPIGLFFKENGIVSDKQLYHLLVEHMVHNLRIKG